MIGSQDVCSGFFVTQRYVTQASQSSWDRRAELDVFLATPSTQSACGMEDFMKVVDMHCEDVYKRQSLLWGHGAFGIVFFFTDLLIDGYRLLIFRSRLVHDLDIEGIDADADLCAHREHIGGVYQPFKAVCGYFHFIMNALKDQMCYRCLLYTSAGGKASAGRGADGY